MTKNQGTDGSYTYVYNADSNIKEIVDTINNNTKSFTYDLAQRLVKEINTNGFTAEYEYDINNNVNNIKYSLNDTQYNTKYNFDNYNRLNSLVSNNSIWKRETDRLSRINKNVISNELGEYKTNYEYANSQKNGQTTYVSKLTNGDNTPIEYEYYMNGNIKTIKIGDKSTTYYYDGVNRLIRENNKALNKTMIYSYDSNGNILNKKEYAYMEGDMLSENANALNTIVYTYGNNNWKDQLTNYNGKAITYDALGNILTYDGNTYTWQNGRQLSGISNSNKNQTITYKYNENGIRTQKIVNGVTTNYYLDGAKVIYEQTGNNIIYYVYDENRLILGLNHNGIQYYYIKNAQNDIIGILNYNLEQVVSYTYDSWEKIVSIKDTNRNVVIGRLISYTEASLRVKTNQNIMCKDNRKAWFTTYMVL